MRPVEAASLVAVGAFSVAGLASVLRAYRRKQQAAKKSFGRELKQAAFCIDEDIYLCNNGSFSAVPRPVLEHQQRLMMERERNPELWYRWQYDPKNFPTEGGNSYAQAVMAVADFVGAKAENLVLVENTTTGINCVLQNLPLKKGDKILLSTHNYGAVLKTVQYVCGKTGAEVVTIEFPLPIESEDDLVKLYADVLEQHSNIRVAVLDHITSPSAIVMPIERLVALCHQKDVLVLVDGAHGPGQVSLSLEKLHVDFYVGNLHKWLFAPRGCALLWVHPSHHDNIRHVTTSTYLYAPTLMERFCYIGTRDNLSYYCAAEAIRFHQDLGGLEAITAHNSSLSGWAADMLAKAWNTEQLPIPAHMRAPFMAVVAVPENDAYPASHESCGKLMADAMSLSGAAAAFSYFNGKIWCRISSHVYNCQEDYYKLRDALMQLLQINQ